mmetsp:Transcript_2636/g.3029  ORF Transcript_2636/g.3029 Transcript_2636/m.3029 type:complete len:483 (+) Transcript_2636:35-1483(+)
MPASFHIEKAKSGRSKCKKCKEPIVKGNLRIGNTTERTIGDETTSMTSWNCLSCFILPRNLKRGGVTPISFVEDNLNDPDDILGNHMEEVITAITVNSSGGARKNKTNKEDSSVNKFLTSVKRNSEALANDSTEQPCKRVKKMSKMEKKEAELYDDLKRMTIDQLKDYLRWNRQIVGGTKQLLILKCLDGALRGRLGRCPMCARAKLKIEDATSEVAICAGYFDEEAGLRVPACTAVSLSLQEDEVGSNPAPRLHPWYRKEPSEEEAKELDSLDEQAASGKIVSVQKSKSSSYKITLAKLLEEAEKITWKVGNKVELKETATALLEVGLNGGLALPSAENGGTKTVGRVLVANARSASPSKILKLLIDEFGFAADKAEEEKAATAAISNICKVETNVGCYLILDEFSKLSQTSGDFRKANSYRKAAQAIAGLNMEVTIDNALSLGKASSKNKLPGVGKSIAEKINEFVATGSVEKLEELRAS